MVSCNASFQVFGIGTGSQHFRIVIAFQVGGVGLFEGFGKAEKRRAEVGKNSEPLLIVFDEEADGVDAVVRCGDRLDGDAPEDEAIAWDVADDVFECADPGTNGTVDAFADVDRDSELSLEYACTARMVGVVMGDDKCLNVAHFSAVGGHA